MKRTASLLAPLLALSPISIHAAEPLSGKDQNYTILKLSAEDVMAFDKNKNGTRDEPLEPDEWKEYQKVLITKIQAEYDSNAGTVRGNYPTGTPVTEPQIQEVIKPKPQDDLKFTRFQIRGSYKELTALGPELMDADKYKAELDKATPANLSYARSFRSNKDSWNFKGAIGYTIVPQDTYDQLGVVASLAFDRVDEDRKRVDDVDSLAARLGFNWISNEGDSFIDSATGWIEYGSDFALEKDIYGLSGDLAMDARPFQMRNVGKFIFYPTVHMEGGHVGDHGGDIKLFGSEDYLRAGPELKLIFIPSFAPRFQLSLSDGYYWDLLDHYDRTLFEAGLAYTIDSAGHISLNATYKYGQLPLTMSEVDEVSIGIGLKW